MPTDEEKLKDYQKRATEGNALIQQILTEKQLIISAQFNTDKWPNTLEPVVSYIDAKVWPTTEASPKATTRAKARAKRKGKKK